MGRKTETPRQPGDIVAEIQKLFLELCQPCITKAEETAVSGTRNPDDVGNAKPVPVNLVFWLRGAIQNLVTILKGAPRASRNGRTVYSIKDNRDYYQSAFMKLEQKHSDNIENLVIDPQYQYVSSRMESAFAAYDLFEHLETLLKGVFKEVAGEDWTPYETQPQTAMAAAITEAAKRAALERHHQLKQKVAS